MVLRTEQARARPYPASRCSPRPTTTSTEARDGGGGAGGDLRRMLAPERDPRSSSSPLQPRVTPGRPGIDSGSASAPRARRRWLAASHTQKLKARAGVGGGGGASWRWGERRGPEVTRLLERGPDGAGSVESWAVIGSAQSMPVVKNINGTSGKDCPCGSWITHYRKHAATVSRFCVEASCIADSDLVGAHVQKDDPDDRNWYIIPLCKKHNAKAASLTIAMVSLVLANVAKTCGA